MHLQVILLTHMIDNQHDVRILRPFFFDFVNTYLGDELRRIVSIVVDLASTLDPDGVDVYFLNRQPLLNVRSSAELATIFAMEPEGLILLHIISFFSLNRSL